MNELFGRIATELAQAFNFEFLVGSLATLITSLAVGGSIFALYYVFWRIFRRLLRTVLERTNVDPTAAAFLQMITKYVLLTIGTVHALGQVGVDTGALLTSLGIAGLTIGFAARDALSNVISGLFIFWDRPFVLGDLVETGSSYGRVDDITLRSTRIVTTDGRMLAVPNSQILNGTVASYTNFPHLRLDIPVQIGVNENIDQVRRMLLGIVTSDSDFMEAPAPEVVVTGLGDYNITLELRAWLGDERQHTAKRLGLRESMFKRLTDAGVDMPYETLVLQPVTVRNVA